MHNAAPAGLGGKAALGRGFLGPVRAHRGSAAYCGPMRVGRSFSSRRGSTETSSRSRTVARGAGPPLCPGDTRGPAAPLVEPSAQGEGSRGDPSSVRLASPHGARSRHWQAAPASNGPSSGRVFSDGQPG